MYVTDRLIYLQLQKTGCNSSRKIIEAVAREGTQFQIHSSLQSFETEKKIAGNIRNPWDWYVSIWAYGCAQKGGLFDRLTQNQSNFSLTSARGVAYPIFEHFSKRNSDWVSLYSDASSVGNFKKWLKKMYSSRTKRWLGEFYFKHPISEFAGFYTFRYGKLYLRNFFDSEIYPKGLDYHSMLQKHDDNFLLDYVIRTEALEEETFKVLAKLGYDISDFRKDQDMKKVVVNKSKHLMPVEYYDSETLSLVAEKERLIIEKYNYDGPSK